jgi:hypothetical protein
MKRGGLNLDVLSAGETAGCDRRDSIYISRQEQAKKEYDRIKGLVENSDPQKVELLDGLIWEAAKARAQLRELNDLAYTTGPIRISAENPHKQQALPVIQELTKVRASYTHLMDRLMKHLDFSGSDEDDSFADFL